MRSAKTSSSEAGIHSMAGAAPLLAVFLTIILEVLGSRVVFC